MPLLDHFGLIAPLYDRLIPLRRPERLIELAELPSTGALLDAGGGTGRVSSALKGLVDRVVVVDVSRQMLAQARQNKRLDAAQAEVERLPFSNGTFERVLMVDALHHVSHQVGTCMELWRVLKPGGRLVIEEPDVRTLAVKFVALGEKIALMRSHFLTPPEIAAMFAFPGATTTVHTHSWNAWVVVEKQA